MKKVTLFLLVMTIIFSMFTATACSNQGDGSANDQSEPPAKTQDETPKNTEKENIELRFSWWGAEERHEAILKVIELYESQNENVKILPEYSGFTGYQDKLTAQIAGMNAPDIFAGVSEWFPQQAASDALLDLTGLVDVSGQNPQIVESCSIDGKLYGVNMAVNAATYTYNKRILDDLGIELPPQNYTWDDFADKCIEISEKSGGEIYGAVDSSVAYEQFIFFGYTHLQKDAPFPYDNDKLTCTAEDVAEYYRYWANLREKEAVAPPEISVTSVDNSLAKRGIAVFVPVWSSTFPQFQNESEDELGMIIMPNGPDGERPDTSRPGITLSVYKNSKHAEEAAAFVDFFANDLEGAKLLKTNMGVLPTAQQRETLVNTEGLLSDVDKKVFEITNVILAEELKPFYPGPNGISEVFGLGKLLEKIGQEVAFDKISIEDGAEKFMVEAQKILDSSN